MVENSVNKHSHKVNEGRIYMPRRGDHIHKRKDGRWEGRYRSGIKEDGTTAYHSVYGKTYGVSGNTTAMCLCVHA